MSLPAKTFPASFSLAMALAKVIIYGLLAFWTVMCLFPLYWVATISVKSGKDIDRPATYLPFVDFTPSLDAWRFILSDPYENLVSRFVNSPLSYRFHASHPCDWRLGNLWADALPRCPSLAQPSYAVCLAVGLADTSGICSGIALKLLFVIGATLLLALALWCLMGVGHEQLQSHVLCARHADFAARRYRVAALYDGCRPRARAIRWAR